MSRPRPGPPRRAYVSPHQGCDLLRSHPVARRSRAGNTGSGFRTMATAWTLKRCPRSSRCSRAAKERWIQRARVSESAWRRSRTACNFTAASSKCRVAVEVHAEVALVQLPATAQMSFLGDLDFFAQGRPLRSCAFTDSNGELPQHQRLIDQTVFHTVRWQPPCQRKPLPTICGRPLSRSRSGRRTPLAPR